MGWVTILPMSKSSKLIGMTTAVALAAGAWALWPSSEAEVAKADKLANQVWIDRVPENDRDMITHLLLLDHPRAKNFGVIGHSSQWRHHIEVARWRLDGNTLGLFFPQERHKARLKARTWSCEGEAPAPFDLCLELSRGDRKLKMYSHHDWVVEPQADAEDAYEELIENVPALSSLHEIEIAPLGDFDDDDYESTDVLGGPLAELSGAVDEDED